jgi:hypothetical protein
MDQGATSDREPDRAVVEGVGTSARESAKETARQYVDAMTKDPRQIREWLGEKDLTYGGLIGIGVVMVQPFLGTAPRDLPGIICVVAFALAIPLLAALVLLNRQEAFRSRFARSALVTVGQALGQFSAVVGIIAGFWHIYWLAGAVMLASVFLAMGVHSAGFMSVESELEPLAGAGDTHGHG